MTDINQYDDEDENEDENYDQAAEIAEALKIYIITLSKPAISEDAPAAGKVRDAWMLAQWQKNLDDIVSFIELEIQPNFPVEITQELKPNMLFVKAETDEAAAELYKIPGCHVSRMALTASKQHRYWNLNMPDLQTYIVMDVEPIAPEELQKQSGKALTDWQDAQTRDNRKSIKALIEDEVALLHPIEFVPDFFNTVILVKTTEEGAEAIKELQGVGSVTIPASFKLFKKSSLGRRTLHAGDLPPFDLD